MTAPGVNTSQAGPQAYQSADGRQWVGWLSVADGTPWASWVQFPREIVIAPIWALMNRLLVLGLVFIAISLMVVWALSARITMPLDTLTAAVGAFAAGDYSPRVTGSARNEVGRLSMAFNSMAEQLTAGHHALEARAKALYESEARKSAVVSGALDCIITLDPAGIVTDINPAAEEVFGYMRADVLGKPFSTLVTLPAFTPGPEDAFRDYLTAGETVALGRRLELQAIRKDGLAFTAEVSIIGLRTEDRPGFSAFVRDLTDQKAGEAYAAARHSCSRRKTAASRKPAG